MKFSGTVVKGDGRGAALGFPTANLNARLDLDPGVYAVWVYHLGEKIEGVLCYGVRDAEGEMKCEVHLLDYAQDLYGRELSIEIVGDRLSEVRDIDDRDELRRKIESDIAMARKALKN